jgi:DNA repair protein RecO
MNQIVTRGIVLTRIDFGEANRIVTFLTPDQGKLRLMAKGVRKIKSKLAGGIELFSVSDITFIRGRGDIGTLVSARLATYYGNIVADIGRVQLGYELIKILSHATEDETEAAYFVLLEQAFQALDHRAIDATLISLWFQARLLTIAGHSPNLRTDKERRPLTAGSRYAFDFEHMCFEPDSRGSFDVAVIKFLRLLFTPIDPKKLNQIGNLDTVMETAVPLVSALFHTFHRT